jgi:hypothetical protein
MTSNIMLNWADRNQQLGLNMAVDRYSHEKTHDITITIN